MGDEQKKFLSVLVLCAVIFFGGEYLIQKWRGDTQPPSSPVPPAASQELPELEAGQGMPESVILTRDQALGRQRIRIEAPGLKGSLNLIGASFDDLSLTQYHEATDPRSPEIVLLSPRGTREAYEVFFRWSHMTRDYFPIPRDDTEWQADRNLLTPETPVTLSWNNGLGLTFQQIIRIDDQYMFEITHKVINTGTRTYHFNLSSTIRRHIPTNREGNFLLYEGPLGTFEGAFQEISYEKIQEKGSVNPGSSLKSWLGITDKYWLVALLPEGQVVPFFQASSAGAFPLATVHTGGPRQLLGPGETITSQMRFFAGPKILSLLDSYEKKYGLDHFDLAVDFGWFYFLTKPIFYALTWLKGLTGNFGFAILVFTVLLKILFFPLANRSYHAMARMKRLQPALEQLRARYKEDPAKLNQEMMAFYKKEKVNPVSGCLPMLLQIPAFFALYKVLFISIEMRHAPFLGWIHDLAAPDPTNLFTLFGLISWSPPAFMHLGLWPLLMGASMILQQQLNPPPVDPIQRKMFLYVMPLVFTFMLGQFASGLVIYWTWNNLLSVTQQWLIMRTDLRKSEKKKRTHKEKSAG